MQNLKQTKVMAAYEKCAPARKALQDIGARCMEVTEDKCGILWERYFLVEATRADNTTKATNIILYATPDWWDVFVPLTKDTTVSGTLAAIAALKG